MKNMGIIFANGVNQCAKAHTANVGRSLCSHLGFYFLRTLPCIKIGHSEVATIHLAAVSGT